MDEFFVLYTELLRKIDQAFPLEDDPTRTAQSTEIQQRMIWGPIVDIVIPSVLNGFTVVADSASDLERKTTFRDEDIDLITKTFVAAPCWVRLLGLDDTARYKIAELTAKIFKDRTRFVSPVHFRIRRREYQFSRNEGTLVVQIFDLHS